MLLSLLYPRIFYALKIPVAFFEGYSFYCFFALIVENLGGPNRTVKLLINKEKDLCCHCLCPANKEKFYLRTLSSEWHFVFTRTAIVFISTVFYYFEMKKIFLLLQIFAFLILSNGIMSILNLYENVLNESKNINGVFKFFVLKFAVGLMVVQGFFVEYIIATKQRQIHDVLKPTLHYQPEDRAIRIFCFVTLLEYALLSICMYFAFSSEMPIFNTKKDVLERKGLLEANISSSSSIGNNPTMSAVKPALTSAIVVSLTDFTGSVFKFSDVFRQLEEKLELENEN
jgi:hypothetical protein